MGMGSFFNGLTSRFQQEKGREEGLRLVKGFRHRGNTGILESRDSPSSVLIHNLIDLLINSIVNIK